MANATYTPGPWAIEDRGVQGVDVLAPVEGWSHNPVRIANVVPFRAALATARLIAAAPELLEAAKAALDQLPQFPGDCPFSRLRDAVARAEGRDE